MDTGRCLAHKEPYLAFCNAVQCKKPICSACIKDHSDHSILDIDGFSSLMMEHVNSALKLTGDKMSDISSFKDMNKENRNFIFDELHKQFTLFDLAIKKETNAIIEGVLKNTEDLKKRAVSQSITVERAVKDYTIHLRKKEQNYAQIMSAISKATSVQNFQSLNEAWKRLSVLLEEEKSEQESTEKIALEKSKRVYQETILKNKKEDRMNFYPSQFSSTLTSDQKEKEELMEFHKLRMDQLKIRFEEQKEKESSIITSLLEGMNIAKEQINRLQEIAQKIKEVFLEFKYILDNDLYFDINPLPVVPPKINSAKPNDKDNSDRCCKCKSLRPKQVYLSCNHGICAECLKKEIKNLLEEAGGLSTIERNHTCIYCGKYSEVKRVICKCGCTVEKETIIKGRREPYIQKEGTSKLVTIKLIISLSSVS